MKKKLFSIEAAVNKIAALKKQKKIVVFTNGCFDIVHAGHIQYLEQAKKLGDFLVLGVNSDKSISRLKGPKRPLVGLDNRVAVLSALNMVDMIVVFEQDTPVELLTELKPDIDVKGGDYKKEDLPEYPVVKKYGGQVKILPFKEGFSTTELIKKIVSLYAS